MKQLKNIIIRVCLCLFVTFFSFQTNAQIDSLRLALDNVFAHVDKSQVPGGFLEEYGAQLST